MKLSITKAAELANVSRTTLYNDMGNGKLTFETDGKDRKVIDISELERVYGPLRSPDKDPMPIFANLEQNLTKGPVHVDVELAVLREKLKTLEVERTREREQFSSEIEHLRDHLEAVESERKKLTAVITDQREDRAKRGEKESEQDRKMQTLEETIKQLRIQNKRIFRNLQETKARSFWQRLFG